jgi:hypothetical protein
VYSLPPLIASFTYANRSREPWPKLSDATDPRDKLYAVLGLVDEREDAGIQPYYTLRFEEIYTRLAKTIITRSQSLDCLGSAGLVRNHGVRSWVPDWTVQHDRTPQPFYQADRSWNDDSTIKSQRNTFNASKDTTPEIAFDRMDKRPVARGFCFDKVEEGSMPRPWPDEIPEDRRKNWIEIANSLSSTRLASKPTETRQEKKLTLS